MSAYYPTSTSTSTPAPTPTPSAAESYDDLYLLARHSNLSARVAEHLLQQKVYSSRAAWQQFLRLLLLTLGVGFTAAGILFFFAYNWAALHPFAKLGLIEALLIATTLFAVYPGIDKTLRRFVLTAAAVLVGILFAVYGQIYQTGANAYDLFLAWTACITIWVVAARFAPLWLLYLLLIDVTLILYSVQVAWQWSGLFTTTMLFLLQWLALALVLYLPYFSKERAPAWLSQTVALATAGFATAGVLMGMFLEPADAWLITLLVATLLCYAWLLYLGWQRKTIFYPALTGLSLLILLCALIQRSLGDTDGILLTAIVIIAGTTALIKSLLHLQKKWAHEP